MGHNSLSAIDNTHQVDVENPAPVLVIRLLNGTGRTGNTGIVYQHVYLAEARDRLFRHRLPLLLFADVHGHCENVNTLFLQGRTGLLKLLCIDIADDDIHALLSHCLCNAETNALSTTADDGCLSRKLRHSYRFHFFLNVFRQTPPAPGDASPND